MISDEVGLQHNSFMCTCKVFKKNCKNVSVAWNKEIWNLNQGSVFYVLGGLAAKWQVVRGSKAFDKQKCSKSKLNKKTVKSQVLSKAHNQFDWMIKLLIFSKWVLVE